MTGIPRLIAVSRSVQLALGSVGIFFDLGIDIAVCRKHHQYHQARDNAGQKEHSDGGAGRHAIDNKSYTWWDKKGDITGINDQPQGERAFIAGLEKHGTHGFPPMAATVAWVDPETAPNSVQLALVVIGKPPGRWPTKTFNI